MSRSQFRKSYYDDVIHSFHISAFKPDTSKDHASAELNIFKDGKVDFFYGLKNPPHTRFYFSGPNTINTDIEKLVKKLAK
jgi:hypothetical protein